MCAYRGVRFASRCGYGQFVNCPCDPSSVICFANATFPQGGRLFRMQTDSKPFKKAPLSKGAVTEGDWGIQRCLQRSVFGQPTRRRFFAALRMTDTNQSVIPRSTATRNLRPFLFRAIRELLLRPLIRHLLRKCHLPPRGKALELQTGSYAP